ncbi:deazaflavin-dependent oxidoreductase, nitroreductase family [Mycobacteroides abscessus subsp. abscessus]|nr:deazaflavin-dependent oxidoreductase, nitroreductase family [Mycobacteroides abscessus subsp. abscessus]
MECDWARRCGSGGLGRGRVCNFSPPRPVLVCMESLTQRIGNAVTRRILRTPLLHRLVSGRLLIVTVRGRRTGAVYRIPVGYVEVDGRILVGTGGSWYRNLRGGGPVELLVRGRRVTAAAEVIDGIAEAAQLYGPVIAHNPVHGRYAGVRLLPDGSPDREDLEAAYARGVRLLRFTPTPRRNP